MDIKLEELIKKMNTPEEIQRFLDTTPFKERLSGPNIMPPKNIIERINNERGIMCQDAATLTAFILKLKGFPPLILSLYFGKYPDGVLRNHALFIYQNYKLLWGGVGKSSYTKLEGRKPEFLTIRELAQSYEIFQDYKLDNLDEKYPDWQVREVFLSDEELFEGRIRIKS